MVHNITWTPMPTFARLDPNLDSDSEALPAQFLHARIISHYFAIIMSGRTRKPNVLEKKIHQAILSGPDMVSQGKLPNIWKCTLMG